MSLKALVRMVLWGMVLFVLAGCREEATPTAVSVIGTSPALATETAILAPTITPTLALTPTPATRPPTAVPDTVQPSSSTPEPTLAVESGTRWPTVTVGPSVTPTPTAYSALDLQATVLARSPNPFTSLTIEGSLALIGHGTRLVIVNIANPTQLELVGELEVANRIVKVQAAGSTVYLVLEIPNPIETEITFHTVDITDPAHPVLLDSYIPEFVASDAVVIGEIVYIVGLAYHMEAIDVSDPANLYRAKTILEVEVFYCFPAGTNIFAVKEEMGYLHLLQGSCRSGGRYFEVMDISDPLNPEKIGSVGFPYSVRSMDIVYHENYAFTLIGGFVRVFDISDWRRPALLTDLVFPDQGSPRTNGKLIVVDGIVYYSSAVGLDIFEQTERFQTTLLNSLYRDVYISDMTEAAGYVYLLDWANGLLILDTADPVNPVEVGRWGP